MNSIPSSILSGFIFLCNLHSEDVRGLFEQGQTGMTLHRKQFLLSIWLGREKDKENLRMEKCIPKDDLGQESLWYIGEHEV